MLEVAKEYEAMGLFPVPCNVSKDSCEVWAKWRDEPKSADEWADMFNKQNGIGIKLGVASSNLIVIDIDQKNDSTATLSNRFIEAIKYRLPNIWDSFYIEETRSGGLHIFLRVHEYLTEKYIPAYTMDLNKAGELQRFPLIEVLCEGQIVFTHPTPNYRIFQGSIEEIPTITKDEWIELMQICQSFNEAVPENTDVHTNEPTDLPTNAQRPGDIFNRRVEPSLIVKYMTQKGWKVHKKVHDVYFLTRPGKDDGVSATFNFGGRKLLCVFSSSTEFEAHTPEKPRGYKPFSIMAKLFCGGDYSKTAAFLVKEGYVNPDEWDDVAALEVVKAEPFGLDPLLPPDCDKFKRYISEVSETFQVATEMALLPAISIASLALSGAARVRINDDWVEDAPIWSIVVANASERKSPVHKELLTPLDDYLSKFAYENKRAISSLRRKKTALQAKLKTLDDDYNKAIKKGADGADAILQAIDKVEAEIEDIGSELNVPDLLHADATTEALVPALKMAGETIGVITAEAEPIENMLGLYTDKPNFSLYLKGYSCEKYIQTRIGRESITIEQPRIVVSVLMQSEPMEKLASSRQAIERGFIGRCMFAVPKSKVGERDLNPPKISNTARFAWESAVEDMMALPHRKRLIEDGKGGVRVNRSKPVDVELSDEAELLFMQARLKNEEDLKAGGELDDISGWGGKLMGNVARLALSLHFIGGHKITEAISGETMSAAIAWVQPLTEHYFSATGHVGDHKIDKLVHRTMQRLTEKGLTKDGARLVDVANSLRTNRMNTTKAWQPVFDRMQELGFIRMIDGEKPKQGPAPRVIKFHPDFANLAK
jgi:hypothetical protein